MKKVCVVGATGGLGSALVFECVQQQIEVVAFSRNEQKLNEMFGQLDGVTCLAGDALKEADVLKAAAGTELLVNAINFPYQQWEETQLKSLQYILNAAKHEKIPFVMLDNIYAYSQSESPINEQSDKTQKTKKGKIRVEMGELIRSSGVNYIHCHIPDVYGPHAVNALIYMMLDGVQKNKAAIYMGKPNTIREYAYTPDVAKAVLALCKDPSAYNQTWNIPGALRVNGYELRSLYKKLFNYKKTFFYVSKLKLAMIGIFSPVMREVNELFYLYDKPLLLDAAKLDAKLPDRTITSIEESLVETYKWMEEKKNISLT